MIFSLLTLLGAILIILAVMGLLLWLGWLRSDVAKEVHCPYTGTPLRHAETLNYRSMYKVNKFLERVGGYDNPEIDFNRAMFSRDTGRIYPKCINRFGQASLDWTFLTDRYEGKFVSWGSLSSEQQEEVRFRHGSLDGFQTEISSPTPSPSRIEKEYAYRRPGPLYVDIETYVLMGWMLVPDTDLEVLIVKRPMKRY